MSIQQLNIRLDWSEQDMYQHINNVAVFKFVQASRVQYLDTLGLEKMYKDTGIGPVLAKTGCQFIQPLYFPGNVEVKLKIKSIGTTSFVLEHEIYNQSGELSGIAEDVIVVFDYNENEKVEIPEAVRKQLVVDKG